MKRLSRATPRINVPKWMKFRDRPENANFKIMFSVDEQGICSLIKEKLTIYRELKMQTRAQMSPVQQSRNVVSNSHNETTQPLNSKNK